SPHTIPRTRMKAIFPAVALAFAVASAVPLRAQAAAPGTAPGDSARHAWRIRLRREFRASMVAHGIARPDALLLLSRSRASGPMQVSVLEGTLPDGVLAELDPVINAEPPPLEAAETMLLRPEDTAE